MYSTKSHVLSLQYYPQQKGLNKNAKMIKGKNSSLSINKNIPPITLKINANMPNIKANKKIKGEKVNTITMNINFSPSINNTIAINNSIIPPNVL